MTKGDALALRQGGERRRELEAIARLVVGQAQAAGEQGPHGGERRLGGDAARRVEDLEGNAIPLQHLDVLADGLELLPCPKQLQRALLALVVADARRRPKLDQLVAAVLGQPHHASLVEGVALARAIAQHGGEPGRHGGIGARPQDQRRVLHEQPLGRLLRDAGSGPGGGVAGADLAGVGEARLQRRTALPVDHGDLVSGLGEVIGRRDADHAAPQDRYFHGRLRIMGLGPERR